MVAAFKKFISNYFNFKGRSTRKDFWFTILDIFIITIIIGFIVGPLQLEDKIVNLILELYGLILIIPMLSLEIRRLHDINKSGWWILLSLIPGIGSIILIVFYCTPSINENNKYGAIE